MKNTNYYNKESEQYSEKRYPETELDYVHFFFKKRLAIVINLLNFIVQSKNNLKLLEVGCADGVVIYSIEKKIKNKFSEMIGIDISPKMIETAKANIAFTKIKFRLRQEEEVFNNLYDIIIEIGVINYTDMKMEFEFVKKYLKSNGYYVCSLASSTSILSKLKPEQKKGCMNCLTYQQYEYELNKYFQIVKIIPCGFFIPHIWKVPFFARFIQPLVDFLFSKTTPNLFHEKIYLLKMK